MTKYDQNMWTKEHAEQISCTFKSKAFKLMLLATAISVIVLVATVIIFMFMIIANNN